MRSMVLRLRSGARENVLSRWSWRRWPPRCCSPVSSELGHRRAVERDLVGVLDETVENGVGAKRIREAGW
jgi:hypothetical protein